MKVDGVAISVGDKIRSKKLLGGQSAVVERHAKWENIHLAQIFDRYQYRDFEHIKGSVIFGARPAYLGAVAVPKAYVSLPTHLAAAARRPP
ncbi:hypothetical protein EVAR_8334_1 [Eumeta japonica]|uniref:Uncharacterized protein n=1 Tax=Eumeta variegata TaxID=151549 RepID=A0A4C1VCC5_EUMVA|nr:hypothetical protein EVAR_8334_1 [Eumeta japonica]